MPTNYNFSNKTEYLKLKFPNVSTSAQRLFLFGTQPAMRPGPNQADALFATISVVNLNAANLSPGKENQALRITPTGTNEAWDVCGLNLGVSPRPDLLDYGGTSTRNYRLKFSYRGNASSVGRQFNVTFSERPLNGAGGAAATLRTVTISDTNWNIAEFVNNLTFTSSFPWLDFGGFSAHGQPTPNYNWTPSDYVEIADFELTWDEQPVTTTSFDNQFIPADTFRQGNLWTWGNAGTGQLGQGSISGKSTPAIANNNSYWKDVAGSTSNTAAITTTGSLWTAGLNSFGRLGTNENPITRAQANVFVREFTSSTNWVKLALAVSSTAAIKTDGTLWVWGNNSLGELGTNDTISRSTPVQEATSSTNWKNVSAGGNFFAALKTDGTLWLWGNNNFGQVGNNTQGNIVTTPTQEFTSSNNWKQFSCGESQIMAIKTNGTLWGWGNKQNGRLADYVLSILNAFSTPVQETTSSTNWKQVSTGATSSAAIKTDGTLWTWGLGSFGKLGQNDNSTRETPAQEFTSRTNWKQVNCLSNGTAALTTDGKFFHTGLNQFSSAGGTNDLVDRLTFTQEFTQSTDWLSIGKGSTNAFIIAIKKIDPVI